MPNESIKRGSELAQRLLNSGVHNIKGEKDYHDPTHTKVKLLKCKRDYYYRSKKDPIKMAAARKNKQKYISSCGKFPPREWEKWEIDFLMKNQGFPARIIAFSLQRGIYGVQEKRKSLKLKGELWQSTQRIAD